MLIAGNWKMFKTRTETAAFCDAFTPPPGVEVVICPPYTSLTEVVASGLTTYAQNVHWEDEGAFTGEISAPMLLDLGVAGAIVGHSERRQHFDETDETAWSRAEHALARASASSTASARSRPSAKPATPRRSCAASFPSFRRTSGS